MESIDIGIQIKWSDLIFGRRQDGSKCPVARAMRRTVKRISPPGGYVSITVLCTHSKFDCWRAENPKGVRSFIQDFDESGHGLMNRIRFLRKHRPFNTTLLFVKGVIPDDDVQYAGMSETLAEMLVGA